MPGEFVDGNRDHLDAAVTENALGEFVNAVLARVKDVADERVQATLATWHAIRNTDADEAKFCIAAARLGIDPYDPTQMPDDLAGLLETNLGDPEQPLVRDLTEAAEPASIAEQWSWVQEASKVFHLGPSRHRAGSLYPPPQVRLSGTAISSRHGFARQPDYAPAQPVSSIPEVAKRFAGAVMETPDQNHIPGRNLRAVVGWKDNRDLLIAGPRPSRPDTQCFFDARGLYHGLFTCESQPAFGDACLHMGPTGVTRLRRRAAGTARALSARTPERADRAAVEQLAQEFVASTKVIENQLENAGVAIVDD